MKLEADSPLDTSRCPLCGELNHCATAADPNATECWCEKEEFPQGLLDQLTNDVVRRVCICKKCLENYRETSAGSGTDSTIDQ